MNMFDLLDDNRYKTFWPRLGAGFIDGILLMPFDLIDNLILKPSVPPKVIIPWLIVSCSIYWVYSVIMHTIVGQTVGKMIMKVKVVDLHEISTPVLPQAFLRDSIFILFECAGLVLMCYYVLKSGYSDNLFDETIAGAIIAYAAIVWLFLEVITMLTNQKRRALHDWIAGTVVINCS